MSSKGDLVAMGQVSLGEAQSQFVQKLAESIPSSDVLKQIIDAATKIMQTDLKQMIVDIGMSSLQQYADSLGLKIVQK